MTMGVTTNGHGCSHLGEHFSMTQFKCVRALHPAVQKGGATSSTGEYKSQKPSIFMPHTVPVYSSGAVLNAGHPNAHITGGRHSA